MTDRPPLLSGHRSRADSIGCLILLVVAAAWSRALWWAGSRLVEWALKF